MNALGIVRFMDNCEVLFNKTSYLVYPAECPSVDPVLSMDCMIAIWLNESCTENGTHYPPDLTGTEKDEIDAKSVQYAMELLDVSSFLYKIFCLF